MDALKPREREYWELCIAYIAKHGYPPPIRETIVLMNYHTPSAIQNIRKSLRAKGYIDWVKGKPGTLQILRYPDRDRGVLLHGTIAAGGVVESFPEPDPKPLAIAGMPVQPGSYGLKVMGDSMIGAHICPGDIVILNPVTDVQALRPGSIVAAWVEGEGVTLKHLFLERDRVRLQPANPAHPVIEKNADQVHIQGVLVGLQRQY